MRYVYILKFNNKKTFKMSKNLVLGTVTPLVTTLDKKTSLDKAIQIALARVATTGKKTPAIIARQTETAGIVVGNPEVPPAELLSILRSPVQTLNITALMKHKILLGYLLTDNRGENSLEFKRAIQITMETMLQNFGKDASSLKPLDFTKSMNKSLMILYGTPILRDGVSICSFGFGSSYANMSLAKETSITLRTVLIEQSEENMLKTLNMECIENLFKKIPVQVYERATQKVT
jgi:hypothetical protein